MLDSCRVVAKCLYVCLSPLCCVHHQILCFEHTAFISLGVQDCVHTIYVLIYSEPVQFPLTHSPNPFLPCRAIHRLVFNVHEVFCVTFLVLILIFLPSAIFFQCYFFRSLYTNDSNLNHS